MQKSTLQKKEIAIQRVVETVLATKAELKELAAKGFNGQLNFYGLNNSINEDIKPYSFSITMEATWLKNGNSKVEVQCAYRNQGFAVTRFNLSNDSDELESFKNDLSSAFGQAFEAQQEADDDAYARHERQMTSSYY